MIQERYPYNDRPILRRVRPVEWCHFQWHVFQGHATIRRWMSQKR